MKQYIEAIDLICEDLGIREMPSERQKMRFVALLSSKWGFVTVDDISAAFEAYMFKTIDVSEKHYGKFSAEFFIAVIRAYTTKKGKAQIEQKAKEMKSIPMSEDDKQKVREEFLTKIVSSFTKYRETGEISPLSLMWPVYPFFQKKGLIDAELNEQDELRAKHDVLKSMTNRSYKNMDKKLITSQTKVKAQERVILEFYDKIIENNEQIEQYF